MFSSGRGNRSREETTISSFYCRVASKPPTGRTSLLDPLDVAGVTLPVWLANGNRKRQQQPQTVRPKAVDGFKTNIERIAPRTTRLGEAFADFLFVESRWNWFL